MPAAGMHPTFLLWYTACMLVRVIKFKLSPTDEQVPALLEMFRRFSEACNWISEVAFREQAFRQVPLHAAAYHAVREKFGLPAQLAVRAISKVLATAVAPALLVDTAIRPIASPKRVSSV